MNIPLMLYTYITFYMSVFCLMLLTGEPSYMMAPKVTRQTIFVASIFVVTFFNSSFFAMCYKYYMGAVNGRESMVVMI